MQLAVRAHATCMKLRVQHHVHNALKMDEVVLELIEFFEDNGASELQEIERRRNHVVDPNVVYDYNTEDELLAAIV